MLFSPGPHHNFITESYDQHGFQLEDGTDVRGSMICLPNSYVLWEPKRAADITIESLRLLELVIPKIGVKLRMKVATARVSVEVLARASRTRTRASCCVFWLQYASVGIQKRARVMLRLVASVRIGQHTEA